MGVRDRRHHPIFDKGQDVNCTSCQLPCPQKAQEADLLVGTSICAVGSGQGTEQQSLSSTTVALSPCPGRSFPLWDVGPRTGAPKYREDRSSTFLTPDPVMSPNPARSSYGGEDLAGSVHQGFAVGQVVR